MKNMKWYFVLFSWPVCCCISKSYAQKEDNIWAFGINAALDLNSGTPEFISGYQTFIQEGTASFSDPEGNILLYSDGLKIWNRLHSVMPNGYGMHGNLYGSSCQGTVICKYPGSDSLYYIFTLNPGEAPDHGFLRYTMVDMTLDDSLGDVITTQKNVNMDSFMSEKMALARDNYCGYWLVAFNYNDLSYRSYHITDTGIVPPVISYSATIPQFENAVQQGEIKISPNGKMIAHGRGDGAYLELGRFDNSTGEVSDIITIDNDISVLYGCEFSPDSKVLYGFSNFIVQYDITSFPSAEDIEDSEYSLGFLNTNEWGIRLASNEKIYIPFNTGSIISAIDSPNVLGAGCSFEAEAIAMPEDGSVRASLGSKVVINTQYGQGTVINSIICLGDTALLSAPVGYSHYLWSNGTLGRDNHISEPGTYWVRYMNGCIVTVDTFYITVVGSEDCNTSMNEVRWQENEWTAYPNPVRDGNLFIQRELPSRAEIVLYDLSGKELYKRSISKKVELIDVSFLARGLYYLRINSKCKLIVKL